MHIQNLYTYVCWITGVFNVTAPREFAYKYVYIIVWFVIQLSICMYFGSALTIN